MLFKCWLPNFREIFIISCKFWFYTVFLKFVIYLILAVKIYINTANAILKFSIVTFLRPTKKFLLLSCLKVKIRTGNNLKKNMTIIGTKKDYWVNF